MGVIIHDTELLIQFRDPDTKEKAFTAIIKKYQEKLYWHVRRIVVEHEDANDVLQNVFIRVWNGLENFREDAQLYTWLKFSSPFQTRINTFWNGLENFREDAQLYTWLYRIA